jgi:HlyD family secretion protein
MQILVAVDESDVGLIKEGQTARFTVQAYDDVVFTGEVQQVRLQSTVEENVVNYTVVVDADNQGGRLLPGMTATVDFLIEAATDVLTVPNAALRFRPTEAMVAELRARRQAGDRARRDELGAEAAQDETGARPEHRRSIEASEQEEQVSDSTPEPGLGDGFRQAGGTGHRDTPPADLKLLFYLDDEGKPAVAPVRTGITDGQSTAIQSRVLKEGMKVIAGVSGGSGGTTSKSSKVPFQGQQQGGPPRRGPGI